MPGNQIIPEPFIPETVDPLSHAVSRLFGLSYLFPYQRLVVANILEAAEAAGLTLNWPEDTRRTTPDNDISCNGDFANGDLANGDLANGDPANGKPVTPPAENDRGCLGRQIVILPTGA